MQPGGDQLLDRYDLCLKEDGSAFIYMGKLVNLTPKPFKLLLELFNNRGRIVIYGTLVRKLYNVDHPFGVKCGLIPEIHTIQQHKRKICEKIGDDWIEVEDGRGIKLLTKRQLMENRRASDQASRYSEIDNLDELTMGTKNRSNTVTPNTQGAESTMETTAKGSPFPRQVRKRNTHYINPRSLDIDGFIARLHPDYGPRGYVTIAFPKNLPSPSDDFDFRLIRALKKAEWDVNDYFGHYHIEPSGYGITLGGVLDKDGRFPPHLQTLRYAFEKSGMPVQCCILSSDRAHEGVSIIVGAEPP